MHGTTNKDLRAFSDLVAFGHSRENAARMIGKTRMWARWWGHKLDLRAGATMVCLPHGRAWVHPAEADLAAARLRRMMQALKP